MRTIEQIKKVMLDKNYKFFTNGDYNLNIIAVRESNKFDNLFSDTLYIIYKENGVEKLFQTKWTTKAGVYGKGGEKNPYTGRETGTGVDGVAVVIPGQYLSSFEYVTTGSRYPFTKYLRQIKSLKYYRDNDKNGIITTGQVYEGIYATHLHAMSKKNTTGTYISFLGYNPWSAGCNGSPYLSFIKFLALIEKSISLGYKNIFTYTLLEAKDFN